MSDGNTFDREKLLSVGVMGRKSSPTVIEGRDAKGYRAKATKDEHGNVTVEHNNPQDQVDVHIRAPQVRITQREVSHDDA